MCGFVGFWDLKKKCRSKEITEIIKDMRGPIISRGPDDKGSWFDKKNHLILGHQRLSIIDTSQLGHQPMISRNSRFVISYNGEIYNFLDIKNELMNNGVTFKGSCDTEVLIEAISYWGIETTLKKVAGMFAFALWDIKNKKLFLARDRVGIKPLYWSLQNNIFYFGSQSKSFLANKKWKKIIDEKSLSNYFQFGYIPHPHSIYKDTYQLEPGHYLIVNSKGYCKKKSYWNLKKIVNEDKNIGQNIDDVKDELKNILKKVVSQHMVSDVPLGCFLSGGIDSSTIALIMQSISKEKSIKTYSVGYADKTLFDESYYAKQVAKILETEHLNVKVNSSDILQNITKILNEYDEPFADSSQLPTYLLSKVMKRNVTVCLSGDGGDELFGGYNRYLFAKKIKKTFSLLPYSSRKILSKIILSFQPNKIDNFFSFFGSKIYKKFNSDRIHKFADILKIKNFNEVYNHLISFFPENELPLNKEFLKGNNKFNFDIDGPDFVKKMQVFDTLFYLPNDILTKVDRASMAHSLEVRVPFLDHRVIEYAFKLPTSMKIENNQTKVLLRDILYEKIPKKIINRPKMGFAVPLVDWLRGPLKEWAHDLIYQNETNDGVIDIKAIKKLFDEHISMKRNWQNKIWTILVYLNWKKNYYI